MTPHPYILPSQLRSHNRKNRRRRPKGLLAALVIALAGVAIAILKHL